MYIGCFTLTQFYRKQYSVTIEGMNTISNDLKKMQKKNKKIKNSNIYPIKFSKQCVYSIC